MPFYIKKNPGYKRYLEREFSVDQICDLVQAAKEKGLIFQASCFSPNLVEPCLKAEVDVFVINATDLNNPVMLDAIASSKTPFWLATLMATLEEIDWAVDRVKRRGVSNFGLLHGQHIMSSDQHHGVPAEITQLDCINMFKKRYGLVTGFVDHTSSIYMPAIALAKGAHIITKHLAPHENWAGPDWKIAITPKEWKQSLEIFRYAALTLGDSKELSKGEIIDRSLQRRSIFTKKAFEKGHVLAKEDLVALRPGGGLDPKFIENIIGKKITHPLASQHMLEERDIK